MTYVIGAVVGILWGAVVAFLNSRISKKAIEKNTAQAVLAANLSRMVIDIIAIGSVFLLRNLLPFSFEAALIGTVAALGMLTVYFAFRLSKP